MLRIDLPGDVRNDDDMKLLWDHTNIVISIANDILSFKKEMEHSRFDNLVTLLYLQHGTLQAAMDGAFAKVAESKHPLDLAAQRLLSRYPTSDGLTLDYDVRNFVECCKTMCTGNTVWGLKSGRYKLGVDSLVGGVEIEI